MAKVKRKVLNGLHVAVKEWLHQLPCGLLGTDSDSVDSLLRRLPSSYCVYSPMLLLPWKFFDDPTWVMIMDTVDESKKQELYVKLNQATNTTHIAINAPIPNTSSSNEQPGNNAMRKPSKITAISGNFGAPHTNCANPTFAEMSEAFWVSTKQNGIYQTWAPMYTMFSRGNISEKARLLQLPSVAEAHKQGLRDGMGWSAVDLFAGIGYFAFSYARAGAKTVVCWEINPWSVEGFRRGAKGNNWQTHEIMFEENLEKSSTNDNIEDKNFIIFYESNTHVQERIGALQDLIAPIRHVNCGLLPSSANSWQTALTCLDCTYGGWLHIHENLDARVIDSQAASIVAEIDKISQSIFMSRGGQRHYRVALEHVQKVKSYAPNIVHCVLDINVIPDVSYCVLVT